MRSASRPMIIALIGPDGCGKSTVLNCLDEALHQADYRVAHEHLRPNFIPALAFFRARRVSLPPEWERSDRPHAAPRVGCVSSLVRWLYYTLDYSIGFYLKTCRQDVDVILFDRYADDFIIDPLRSRLRAIPWLLRLMWRMLPRPNRIFYLDAPIEVLLTRKQEIEKLELIKIVGRYKALANDDDKVELLDAELSPQALSGHILSRIEHLKSA